MRYFITEEQLERLSRVHMLLAREIERNVMPDSYKIHEQIGKIIASVNILEDNTGTKLKETIINDLSLLKL